MGFAADSFGPHREQELARINRKEKKTLGRRTRSLDTEGANWLESPRAF